MNLSEKFLQISNTVNFYALGREDLKLLKEMRQMAFDADVELAALRETVQLLKQYISPQDYFAPQPIETAPKDRIIYVFKKWETYPVLAKYNEKWGEFEDIRTGDVLDRHITRWLEPVKNPNKENLYC